MKKISLRKNGSWSFQKFRIKFKIYRMKMIVLLILTSRFDLRARIARFQMFRTKKSNQSI